MQITTYKTSHIISFVSAFAVHVATALWMMMPTNPLVINQQAIQISFVAPNASEKKVENNSHKKIVMNLDEKNALRQQKNQKEELKNDAKNLAQGKQTSGRVDPNATATKAAESDPIFNAAYLNNPAPTYPSDARRKGIQGKVLVKVAVKTDGTAEAVEISRSSGNGSLDEAAVDAVRQWRFIPARRGNSVVQANVIVPVEFKII